MSCSISRTAQQFVFVLTCATVATLTTIAQAVPYASAVRNTSGSSYEFVLNEDADAVTILRDGANPLTITSPAAGRHTFDLGGFSSYSIEVTKDGGDGFRTISDDTNLFTKFGRPSGLAINKDPSSPFFGTVYVSNSLDAPTLGANVRQMGIGIYALTADQTGVDLTNFAAVTDPNDITQAKAPGFTVVASSSSPYRINLDDGGNVIVGDWTDANGGIKYASADLTTGGLVLATEGGPTGGVDSAVSDEFGPLPLHGSIVGRPHATGTVGVDLTVWAMDEDMDSRFRVGVPEVNGNNIWRWDVGSATASDQPPTLEVGVGTLTADGATTGQDTAGDPIFLNLNIGVSANAQYNEQFGKWYLSGARFDGNESSLVVLTPETGPDADGEDIIVDWASKQFSIDNELDGFPGATSSTEFSDVFRNATSVAFSPDGSLMYVHRRFINGVDDPNPFVGTGSDLGGAVLAIPLDENGIPDIVIDDNGTPGDTSDDFFSNVESFDIIGNDSFRSNAEVEVDAAGNIYITNNNSELLEVFSPGGSTKTVFDSSGNFTVEFITDTALAGDYSGNGVVDAADYTLWRDTLGDSVAIGTGADGNGNGTIDPGDYDEWKNNFGNTNAAVSSAAVPEPASLLLVLFGSLLLGSHQRFRH